MILDVVCLWISFTLAFNMRHGSLDVLANSLYRDMMWSLALMDIVVIFFFDSLKNVLKRGFYQEFVMTVKQTGLITLCSVFYLFTFKEADSYSRLVLGYTAVLYLLLSYVLRCLWKNCLRKYFGGAEKRSLLIVTVSDIADTVIDNIKNKNYGDYFVTGVCILDKKAKGRVIDGVTVVADEDDLVEYVCREWVDEVFINIPESEPYPAELLDKFIEMGVVVHMKLAKSQNLLGKKQFVEHLGTYTVLTTSINSVSRRLPSVHKELREFIQAPVTDEVSDTFFDCAVRELLAADDSRVKVELEHHAVLYTVFFHEFGFAFFGIHVHTSELIHLEQLSALSDTGLLEEDWSR